MNLLYVRRPGSFKDCRATEEKKVSSHINFRKYGKKVILLMLMLLSGDCTVWNLTVLPTFQRNILPPSPGLK
jgi:hypothetical protein